MTKKRALIVEEFLFSYFQFQLIYNDQSEHLEELYELFFCPWMNYFVTQVRQGSGISPQTAFIILYSLQAAFNNPNDITASPVAPFRATRFVNSLQE